MKHWPFWWLLLGIYALTAISGTLWLQHALAPLLPPVEAAPLPHPLTPQLFEHWPPLTSPTV